MADILNRPALVLAVLAGSALVGYLVARGRGALFSLLLAGAALGALLAWRAASFGLPDALGFFLLGLGLAVGCAGLAAHMRPQRG